MDIELLNEENTKDLSVEQILDMFNGDKQTFSLNTEEGRITLVMRLMVIDPSLAKILLAKNTNNRPLKNSNVSFIKGEIEKGNWKISGEAIKFDEDNNLIDGQHRLNGIISAVKPIATLVITNLKEDIFPVLDSGTKRQGSDALHIKGIENAHSVSAAVSCINKIEKGIYSDSGSVNRYMSNQEICNFVDRNHEDVAYSVKFGNSLYKKSMGMLTLTATLISSIHYILSDTNLEKVEDFFNQVCLGYGLGEKSSTNALRNTLIKDKNDKSSKMPLGIKIRFIVSAWNKFINEEEVNHLRMPTKNIKLIKKIKQH